MRDDDWLKDRMEQIWNSFFSDVEKRNKIIIKFKGKWKNKFGHIKLLKDNITEIAINGMFKDESIPRYLIDVTIAHELVHYMHGFNSPHEKKFRYPHQGGVVRKELIIRGMRNSLKEEKEFIKNKWPEIVKEKFPKRIRRRNPWRLF